VAPVVKADLPDASLLTTPFGPEDVVLLRRTVGEVAAKAGLDESTQQDLILAVDELLTNAVLHGGGRGQLELWQAKERLWFRVVDRGPGLARPIPTRTPPTSSVSGRGLWIAQQLTEQLEIVTGPSGTTVLGCVPLPAGIEPPRP
jgi:anti-sigma regulatory factor (Ser/Thr protein kinase)